MKKPLVTFIQNQYSSDVAKRHGLYAGVGYYRQAKPAKFLSEWYDTRLVGKDLQNLQPEKLESEIVKIVEESDLVWTKHLDNPYAIQYFLGACSYYNKPLIVDFDDHVFTTDGLSPERFVYPDGSDEKHFAETLLRECTAISVSVSALVPVYEKYAHVSVCGNYVDPESWEGLKNKVHTDGRVTIGWVGSASHVVDQSYMIPVFQEVVKRYPQVVFSFMGHMKPEWVAGLLPKGNWSVSPGIGWWEGNPEDKRTYPSHLAEQGYDIGIAPLIHSQFNSCRSATKWMEYSMLEIPTVAENWGPYADKNILCGILNTEKAWVESISELIESKSKRKEYGKQAKQRVLESFSYPAGVSGWRETCSKYVGGGFKPTTDTSSAIS